MPFKNAVMYKFTGPVDVSDLREKLGGRVFSECRPLESHRAGFVAPAKHSPELAYVLGDFILVSLKLQKKRVSQKAVKQKLALQIEELEKEHGRKVLKKERLQIKQSIEADALPKTLPESDLINAVICTRTGQLIVDASSIKKADEFTAYLRETLGSLPVVPFQTLTSPSAGMKSWLTLGEPDHLYFADSVCLFEDAEKAAASLRNVKIDSQAVFEHLSDGLSVSQMAMFHENNDVVIKFTLTDQLTFKAIKVDTEDSSSEDSSSEDDSALIFEADLLLAVSSVLSVQTAVFMALGGIEGESVLPTGLTKLKTIH